MPPRTPDRSYETILRDVRLPAPADLERLFPTEAHRQRLAALAGALDEATAANRDAEATWRAIGEFKDVVLALVGAAVGPR